MAARAVLPLAQSAVASNIVQHYYHYRSLSIGMFYGWWYTQDSPAYNHFIELYAGRSCKSQKKTVKLLYADLPAYNHLGYTQDSK